MRELGWLQTRPESSRSWPGFSTFIKLRLQTHSVSPTLKILESMIKTNGEVKKKKKINIIMCIITTLAPCSQFELITAI